MGMAFAARLSAARGLLPPAEALRIADLLRRVGLPVDMPVGADALLEAAGKDKKREGDVIHFVVLEAIGRAAVVELTMDELAGFIHDLR